MKRKVCDARTFHTVIVSGFAIDREQ